MSLTESDVAPVVSNRSVRVVQLSWRLLVAVEYLRRLMELGLAGVSKTLQHDLPEDHIVFAAEHRAEDHGHAIRQRSHEHGLVLPVIDDSGLVARFALLLKGKVLLEDRGKAVALDTARLDRQALPVLGQLGQIEQEAHVEVVFSS